MTRRLITIFLPLIAPFVMYAIWLWWARRRKLAAGEDVDPYGWRELPWVWLGALGVVLVAATLVTTTMVWREKPGGTYESPRFEDGRKVPGSFKR